MIQEYIKPDSWSIIEEGFNPAFVKASESLFSLGNGAMGQRANFEEDYTGHTFQGSYIAGVYYPDKTRVGWWKNGYPEAFAKVLNAPNWIGIKVKIDDQPFDLFTCKKVDNFKRELNMKEGWLARSFRATLQNGVEVEVKSLRFLSLDIDELGAINYAISSLNTDVTIELEPYLDAGISNMDSNWDDKFWEILSVDENENRGLIESRTMKTNFHVCTFMEAHLKMNDKAIDMKPIINKTAQSIGFKYTQQVKKGEQFSLIKYAGYVVDRNHNKTDLVKRAHQILDLADTTGYNALKEAQKKAWADIWHMSDISIEGDIKAQQGIRFNIFHLNQTYLGKDERLNIGPKGFTGEKYGGSTYWDTEAYCIPFYMATKDQQVARNLLTYRYKHLTKAIENAEKLGFSGGAALYPMVTMNGEECHNEWEITFEEIHRNGAIAFAIFNYVRYTGDTQYIVEKGLEVLIAIARFWFQRTTFSEDKNSFVILGVTGPNEYENNVNNNFYTNYLAKWCLEYTIDTINTIKHHHNEEFNRILRQTGLKGEETYLWMDVADKMYLPFSEKHQVYLQQDGFLDKELKTVAELDKAQRPINQKWSWDRILRSPYIKQADVLQGFYFFEDQFNQKELERHFDFYEPFTVHESSLSPCVHSILAAKLDRMEQAYSFYLRTSRLDLDDYNHEVEEGLHITSMAGTWMSIVEGFGGMRIKNNMLSFDPKIPKQWEAYSFKVNFRGQILKIAVNQGSTQFKLEGKSALEILLKGKRLKLNPEAR